MTAEGRANAHKRLAGAIIGPAPVKRKVPIIGSIQKARMLRQEAEEMRRWAREGFRPHLHKKEAERLDSEAARIEATLPTAKMIRRLLQ